VSFAECAIKRRLTLSQSAAGNPPCATVMRPFGAQLQEHGIGFAIPDKNTGCTESSPHLDTAGPDNPLVSGVAEMGWRQVVHD